MKKLLLTCAFALAFLLTFGIDSNLFAQGRGGGRPAGAGRPPTAGPPAGVGVDRGQRNASTRSAGRSDDGLANAATRSNGRSTSGIDRARLARENANRVSNEELNRFRGLSKRLGTTPEEMRARYEAALLANPDLKYGNFVSAHVVADNLGGRFPNVTADAILLGYIDGRSLGQSLRYLGMTKEQAKIVERDAEMRIKESKRHN